MAKFRSTLKDLKIASPCSADWNEMYGDSRKRFCGECNLNVYNLSGMNRDEAERLITNAEGRMCVRFYQRADGTVITEDCPVGWAKVKQRARVYATAAFSLIIALLSGVFAVSLFSKQQKIVGRLIPFSTPTPMPLMGAIAVNPNSNSNMSYKPDRGATMGNYVTPAKKETGEARVFESKLPVKRDNKNI